MAIGLGLGLGFVLQLAVALFFCVLGWHLATRFPTSPRGRPAIWGFAGYWLFQGLAALSGSVATLVAALGAPLTPGQLGVIVLASQALIFLGVAGFLFYLAFIFAGRADLAWATFVVYALFGASQWWLIATNRLQAIPTDFGTPFYANPESSIFSPQVAYMLALAPFVAGTLGLIFMGIRTKRPLTRFRATLVGGALLFWALANATGYALSFGTLDLGASRAPSTAVTLAPELVALLAAIVVYLAYFPPGRISRWLERREALRG